MEHSLLHAVQLLGVVMALGGPVFILGLLDPASRALGPEPRRDALRVALADSVARWVCWGALAAAGGALVDLLVQAAEVKGRTIFGGIEPGLVVRFATQTIAGQLLLLRAVALLGAAAATRRSAIQNWWVVAGCSFAAAIFASWVSHAAAQPTARASAIAGQLTHITAAAVWMGVLMHLLAARSRVEAATAPGCSALVADIIRRFSPIALLTVSMLGASGVYSAWRFIGTPGAVLTSAYGLTLMVKLTLLVPLTFAGFVNFRIIRPALLAAASAADDGTAARVLRRFGRMLELEVTAGVLVITVAGILGSVAPPGEAGTLRLTDAQVQALLSPDLPTTAIADPETFYNLPERTVDDLRYAEFTHNWSGLFVVVLGVCWLVQASGGRAAAAAGWIWPLLLVPLAAFITVAADPEVWFLRRISLWQAVNSAQIVEHQIGAGLVLVLAWLGRRDQRRPSVSRPLGYALPVLMIFGSLMLLGHAHLTLSITDELGNLINVQHAILGGLGLFAGTVRWLSLRSLFPPRAARLIWPGLIIALGLFMAFGYREVV